MKRRWSLLLLLCLLLAGCSAEASGGQLISAAEGSGAYSEALLPFLPGYALRDGEDTLYAEISQGNAVACFDVQAIPAMDRGVGRYWYPHVSASSWLIKGNKKKGKANPDGISGRLQE